jgi:REP element-mobilizing transposase RayT
MPKYYEFKFPYQYFHFNFEFKPTGYFKSLDWDFLCVSLNSKASEFGAEIQALVMMDTHVHVLFRISNSNENYFSSAVLKTLKIPENIENFVEPIRHQAQYINTYKYIYRNPVDAQLVEKCEDYLYSSLSGLIGKSVLRLNVFDRMDLIQNPIKIMNWLNQSGQLLRLSQLKSLRQSNSFSI